MRVVQVTPQYYPHVGGVENVVQEISESLAVHGVNVIVYSVDLNRGLPRQQEINGVLVKRFTRLLGDPLYLPEPKFMLSLLREKADIVHVHNAHTLPFFLGAMPKHKNQKLVAQPYYHRFGQSSIRHSLLKIYGRGLNGLVFPRADLILTNSVYEKRVLCSDFSACKNVFLLPLGLDLSEIKKVKREPVEPKRILYIGALKPYKNVDKILNGFARFIGRGNTAFRLIIVGDGLQRDSLVRLADRLGIASCVEWKHALSREQLLNEYAKASIFVLLSRLESFSLVVYEALVIGVPAVVLNFGALSGLVYAGLAEGVNSLAANEVADALTRATSKSYNRISEGMRFFLDWKEYSGRILSIYRYLLNHE